MDFGRIKEAKESENDFYTPSPKYKVSQEGLKTAKAFLSVVSPTSDISLYDLLRQIIETVLKHKISDAVDNIEALCYELKHEKLEGKDDFIEIPETEENMLKHINTLTKLFEEILEAKPVETIALRNAEDDEGGELLQDEDVNDSLEEESIPITKEPSWILSYLPDVCHQMFHFNQVGVGLGLDETFEINMAIKVLAKTFRLEKVRFWGKIFTLKCNLYIAEVPYTEGVPIESYGWEPRGLSKPKEDIKEVEAPKDIPDQEESKPEVPLPQDGEATEQSAAEATFKIPPLPEPKLSLPRLIVPENNGTGANKNMYFVCSMLGQPWKVLPQLRPDQVVDARILKKYFTGNLDADVRGCVAFQGKEAHYLRAQIARISASTMVSPSGYFNLKESTNPEEGAKTPKINAEEVANKSEEISEVEENPNFVPLPPKDSFAEGLKAWVHHRPALLMQGRCLWTKSLEKLDIATEEAVPNTEPKNTEANEELQKEEIEKEDIEPELKEKPIPLLRPLSEDRSAGGVIPWTIKRSSSMVKESAVLVAKSNVWPGAFSYFDGRTTDHIYIGHGHKYTARHYAPRLGELWQKEYSTGSNIIEPIDEILEDTSTIEDSTMIEDTSTNQELESSSDISEVKE